MTNDVRTITSFYHSGAIKRRQRSACQAHAYAAAEVEQHGAHRADISDAAGNHVASYVWRSGLEYQPGTAP